MLPRSTAALFLSLILTSGASASDGWYHSYEEARAASEKNGVPMLLHFHASWCGPCRQMANQVLNQPQVKQQLRQGLAAVELDVTRHPDLAQQYGATTVPRDVVVLPDGTHETLNIGFKSTYAYVSLLRNAAGRGARFVRPQQNRVAPPVHEESQPIVGLEGFCPVKLIRDRKWVSGDEQLKEDYRGIVYYFSSEEDRKVFRQNPAAYSPQNLGCDPVALYSDQHAVNGSIRYGVFFDSRLYLFESPENRISFKENPLKYSLIRHAVKSDELSGRRFN